MEYLQELRQIVGQRPLILVGAGVLLFDSQNRLLLIKRTDNDLWGIPGGAMELGESLEDTARRETREEIGFEPGQVELFGVFSGPELYYRYPNGDEVYNVSAVFRGLVAEEAIKLNPDEHSAYRFFAISDLPDNVSPPIKPVLSDLMSSGKHPGV